ncbi:hypothetical protein RB195_005549 [Necator americanus]|uniref:Uncharacterized protein n=1 Tax=Necator americanus TaxID=51031 RepID=A0ABR1BNF1_NECAM
MSTDKYLREIGVTLRHFAKTMMNFKMVYCWPGAGIAQSALAKHPKPRSRDVGDIDLLPSLGDLARGHSPPRYSRIHFAICETCL